MKKPANGPIKYHWHASVNSGGNLSLLLENAHEIIEKEDKETALAAGIESAFKFMKEKGYLKAEVRFLSSTDLAREHGYSRQYWEKLLKEGKILYKETGGGMITTDLWVDGYLQKKDEVDRYVRDCKKVVSFILETGKKSGIVRCPRCETENFNFAVNTDNSNGGCRKCGFHIYTTM